MVTEDFLALLPILLTAAAALAVMVMVAVRRHHLMTVLTALFGYGAAFAALFLAVSAAPRRVTSLLIVDPYALFYMGLILIASGIIAALSYDYLEKKNGRREEFYILLLLATVGAETMVAAGHFASFFLGLELLSVALYGLISYTRENSRSIEAGIKYLMLSAASSAFLLFGMALIYHELGTLQFARMAMPIVETNAGAQEIVFLAGVALMITGLGFKLAVVPFHTWAPDVYEGAPAPVTAFIATVSKGSVVALLLRFLTQIDSHRYSSLMLTLSLIAIASMFVGNLLALLQENVKRILAYSSIAHFGYIVVAFVASGQLAAEAITFYVVAYMVTMLGALGVVTVLSTGTRDADTLEDYRGLFWRRPALAGVFTLMLLSLAGIPLTAGFIGKFYIIAAGVQSALWMLIVLLVINIVISLFYYLRIIIAMSADLPSPVSAHEPAQALSWEGPALLAALTVLLLWLGLYPRGFMALIQHISEGMMG